MKHYLLSHDELATIIAIAIAQTGLDNYITTETKQQAYAIIDLTTTPYEIDIDQLEERLA